jgi:hypothetical protein
MRSGGEKTLVRGIDGQIEPFERPRAQKLKISFLREHDLVHGEAVAHADDRETDAPRDRAAVRHLERHVLLFRGHADGLERRGRDPGALAAAVDQQLRYLGGPGPIDEIGDDAARVKGPHSFLHASIVTPPLFFRQWRRYHTIETPLLFHRPGAEW